MLQSRTTRHRSPPSTLAGILAGTVLMSCAPEPAAPPAVPVVEFQPTATVEDIMRAMVDPPADAMWDAVVTTVTDTGIEEVRPETDEDWLSLERGAVMLVEAGNLLLIDGRRIADEDSVSELPGIDLEPAEIAARVEQDRDAWMRSARELHDAGVVMLNAVRDRNTALTARTSAPGTCSFCSPTWQAARIPRPWSAKDGSAR